jgi:hypothetical protein
MLLRRSLRTATISGASVPPYLLAKTDCDFKNFSTRFGNGRVQQPSGKADFPGQPGFLHDKRTFFRDEKTFFDEKKPFP